MYSITNISVLCYYIGVIIHSQKPHMGNQVSFFLVGFLFFKPGMCPSQPSIGHVVFHEKKTFWFSKKKLTRFSKKFELVL